MARRLESAQLVLGSELKKKEKKARGIFFFFFFYRVWVMCIGNCRIAVQSAFTHVYRFFYFSLFYFIIVGTCNICGGAHLVNLDR